MVAAQGVVLSTLPPLLHGGLGVQEVFAGAVALMLKGVAIPRMLIRALADLPIRREVEPLVGFKTCLVLGAIATSGSVYLATTCPWLRSAAARSAWWWRPPSPRCSPAFSC